MVCYIKGSRVSGRSSSKKYGCFCIQSLLMISTKVPQPRSTSSSIFPKPYTLDPKCHQVALGLPPAESLVLFSLGLRFRVWGLGFVELNLEDLQDVQGFHGS